MARMALAFLAVSFLQQAYAACYLPNGTDINLLTNQQNGDQWKPCTTGDSMCCRTGAETGGDTCMGNGLCHNDVAPNIWRESCTDPTWSSPSCLQFCISATVKLTMQGHPLWPAGTAQRDAHVPVTQCDDGTFCCGRDNTDCCDNGNGITIRNGRVVTATSRSSTGTPTGTSSPTSTGGSGGDSGGSSNTGAIAGGVVGGVAGLVLIVGAVIFFLRRRKRSTPAAAVNGPAEMDDTGARHEMSDTAITDPVKYAKVGNTNAPQAPGVVHVPGTHEMEAR